MTLPFVRRWFDRFVDLQVHRPKWVLLIAAALTAVSLVLTFKLEIHPGFEYLLPQNRASVRELHRVAKQTAGVSTLFVVLHADGGTPLEAQTALRKAGDDLVVQLAKLGAPWVGSAEDGVQDGYRFLTTRAGLYAKLADLVQLKDDLQKKLDYEVAKASGNLIDDDAPPPPDINAKTLEKRFGGTAGAGVADGRYPDGYYASKDSRVLVVAVRSKVLGTDLSLGREAIRRIQEVVDAEHLEKRGIHYGMTGDLWTGVAELTVVNEDLTRVGLTGIVLIGAVVFVYYLRLRALTTMLMTILVGVSWSFAFTELTVGFLNLATGFLFTIIAGNGINAGVIYMARYLEARREGKPLEETIRLCHTDTWLATLTACVAASAAYASLTITEFRGFRDFGLIGAVGMLLCWIATYWTMPALLVILEHRRPLEFVGDDVTGPASSVVSLWKRLRDAWARTFGIPFAWVVDRAPRFVVIVGVGLALAGGGLLVHYIRTDPIEYDMKNLRNDRRVSPEELVDKQLATDITGYVGAEGMAILVDREPQIPMLRKVLYARRDAAPEGLKPFDDIHALEDFVPLDQAAKLPVLRAIKAKVERARARNLVTDADWAKIKDLLPADDLKPFAEDDLPNDVAQAFTEVDGTRGRIVYISPTDPNGTEDAHYLFRWADAYRESKLPDGSTVLGSGRAVIYADMWAAVIAAIPPAVTFSFLTTTLVVIVAFRARKASLLVLVALLVGVGWLGGLFALLHIRLNFLNFIALPITFGIGVDYAVNIVQRYVIEGKGGVLHTVRQTGGAVVLCSLTTTLGYLALVSSVNFAVRSLGVAAVLGEVSCLLAAVLVLPAALMWKDRGNKKRERT